MRCSGFSVSAARRSMLKREMRAATIVNYGMNFVENDRADGLQHFAAGIGRKQEIKGFRRRHQNVRRSFNQRLTLRRSGVAGANFSANINVVSFGLQQFANSSKRLLQIFANVVAQRLERRNVNDLRFVRQSFSSAAAE